VNGKEVDLNSRVRFDDTVLAVPLNYVPPHFCDFYSGYGIALHRLVLAFRK
jgi:hypothetical protein